VFADTPLGSPCCTLYKACISVCITERLALEDEDDAEDDYEEVDADVVSYCLLPH